MNRFGLICMLGTFALLPVSAAFAQDDCSDFSSSSQVVLCSEVAKNTADSQLNIEGQSLPVNFAAQL